MKKGATNFPFMISLSFEALLCLPEVARSCAFMSLSSEASFGDFPNQFRARPGLEPHMFFL